MSRSGVQASPSGSAGAARSGSGRRCVDQDVGRLPHPGSRLGGPGPAGPGTSRPPSPRPSRSQPSSSGAGTGTCDGRSSATPRRPPPVTTAPSHTSSDAGRVVGQRGGDEPVVGPRQRGTVDAGTGQRQVIRNDHAGHRTRRRSRRARGHAMRRDGSNRAKTRRAGRPGRLRGPPILGGWFDPLSPSPRWRPSPCRDSTPSTSDGPPSPGPTSTRRS